MPNPFVYGRPVDPCEFTGRADSIRVIAARILNGDSTAIVGEPHMGKTSLMRYLSADTSRGPVFGEGGGDLLFMYLDAQMFPDDYEAGDFWREILTQLGRTPKGSQDGRRLQRLVRTSLGELRTQHRLVLLVDEFDALVRHPSLGTTGLFGWLRSAMLGHESVGAVVAAGRMSVAEANKIGRDVGGHGSPYFNPMIEECLRPLSDSEAEDVVRRGLVGSGVSFSERQMKFIRDLAGGNPYMVQLCSGAVYDIHEADGGDGDGEERAAERVADWSHAHFEEIWAGLGAGAQTALVVLALAEVNGSLHGREFDTSGVADLEWYSTELAELKKVGLVEEGEVGWNLDRGSWTIWRGRRWRVRGLALTSWLHNRLIPGTRSPEGFLGWLERNEYDGLLKGHEKDELKKLVKLIPAHAKTIAEVIRILAR